MGDAQQETAGSTRRPTRRTVVWVVIAVVAASVIAGVAWWAVAAQGEPSAAPSASASPSTSTSPSPSPSPSASETPDAEATPDGADPAPDAPSPRVTLPPVDISAPAEVVPGVEVRLAEIAAIEGVVNLPGEEAGPALQITVAAVNGSAAELSTPAVIVNVYYGADRTPAGILSQPREDFPTVLAAGESASGVFAFTVPVDQRDDVVVEVDLSVGQPVVLFQGSVPR